MSLYPHLHGIGEDMCGRSGRRFRDRSERRFERMSSCFPHRRETHRCLCVCRRRVLPDIAWCDPARESFPTAVRETWWHNMPYLRNGGGIGKVRAATGVYLSRHRGFLVRKPPARQRISRRSGMTRALGGHARLLIAGIVLADDFSWDVLHQRRKDVGIKNDSLFTLIEGDRIHGIPAPLFRLRI